MRAPGRRTKEPAKRRRTVVYNERCWRKCRAVQLHHQPLCEDCLDRGKTEPATDVHHIRKVQDVPDMMLDMGNLMSLCHRCHSVRTQRGE